MIKEIREYFKTSISEVDSDLKQHNEYFISDNIPDSKLEDTYFLKIGSLSTARQNSSYQGSFDVSLEIWKNGYNDVIDTLDLAYENAIEILSKLQDQTRLDQVNHIKSIVGNSIDVEPVDNNDNLAKFTLNLVVVVGYRSC